MKIKNKTHILLSALLFFAMTVNLFAPLISFADEEPGTPVAVPGPIPEEEVIATTTPSPITARLIVRYQDQFIFDGTVPLATTTVFTYHNSGSTDNATTTSNNLSVLTALAEADQSSDAFSISDLVYYQSFSSFYVNCIQLVTPATNACYNWNYTVNGIYPSIGMDQYALTGGETLYVYFSNPYSITATTSTFPLGTTTTFETWRYQYDNLNEPWTHDFNNLIDISVLNPNPTGWWDTSITVATTTSDTSGFAPYLFSVTGTFYAKITSLDFSKFSDPITIEVTDPIPAPITNPVNNGGSGCGGTCEAPPVTHFILNVDKAIQFLGQHQNVDGSIIDSAYTDWSAVAVGAYEQNSEIKTKLKNYLLQDPNPLVSSFVTLDYERRTMALMALGINPYSGTPTNYIQKIQDKFQNGQFGETSQFNDDIFAIIPLVRAGFDPTDPMIVSSTKFLLSRQNRDGSWDGIDLTGAAVQALSLVPNVDGVTDGIAKAKTYLHSKQIADGSFGGNIFSTAWAEQAIPAFGENETNWMVNNKTPSDFMYSQQFVDGGMNETNDTNRVWATAYAIPAALGKPWGQILSTFTKPNITQTNQNTTPTAPSAATTSSISTVLPTITTSTPTSTIKLAPLDTSIATTSASTIIPNETQVLVVTPSKTIPQKVLGTKIVKKANEKIVPEPILDDQKNAVKNLPDTTATNSTKNEASSNIIKKIFFSVLGFFKSLI